MPGWALLPHKRRYNALEAMEDTKMNSINVVKIKAICEFYGISVKSVAVAGRVSRTYASRVINNDMVASPAFWRRLEQNMGQLISMRTGQVFDIPAVEIDKVDQLLKAG